MMLMLTSASICGLLSCSVGVLVGVDVATSSVGVLVGVFVGVLVGVFVAGTEVLVGVLVRVLVAGTDVFVGVLVGVFVAGEPHGPKLADFVVCPSIVAGEALATSTRMVLAFAGTPVILSIVNSYVV